MSSPLPSFRCQLVLLIFLALSTTSSHSNSISAFIPQISTRKSDRIVSRAVGSRGWWNTRRRTTGSGHQHTRPILFTAQEHVAQTASWMRAHSDVTGSSETERTGEETAQYDDIMNDDDDAELEDDGRRRIKKMDNLERTWRYVKKPFLSIGSTGATIKHGNSLRQLLDAHVVVKVKINTVRYRGSLVEAYNHLKLLAEQSGASTGIELLRARDCDRIILVGLPGTLEKITNNDFPLPPRKDAK